MKKIDIHLHAALDPVPGTEKFKISTGEEMLAHLEELHIEKAVVMSSGETEGAMASVSGNQKCRELARRFPEKYVWMCNLDENCEETIEERLREYQRQGAAGIGEFMICRKINHPFIQAVFHAAEKLGMPILFHMSPQEGYEYGIVDEPGLPMLEEALETYPGLKFIGHSQPFWHEISQDAKPDLKSRMEWGKGPVKEGGRLVCLMRNYKNLYADLSANSGGCAIMRDEKFGLQFLEEFQDRLMFGTDMVNTDMVFPLGEWLDRQYQEGKLSAQAYRKICFENAKKIFQL